MKRIIPVVVGLLVVGGAGLWFVTRHKPAGSLLDEPVSPFVVDQLQPGWRVRFVDTLVPLRALRMITPRQPGILVAQVQTQSDRQQVTIFRDGAQAMDFPLGRPQGVSEGFWRFAQLTDAYVTPTGTALFLFKAGDAASAEASLAMAVDPGATEARWAHRGFYEHMAVSAGTDQAVFLFGPKGPVQRLPLMGSTRRPQAKDIELPAEVPEVEDLLPTSAWTFLASSRNGLSAYKGSKGWANFPGPADKGVPCANWRSTLAQAGKRIWWQPAPGRVVQVAQDGTLVADHEVGGFAPEDPLARDGKLLRLLGADAAGRLWFIPAFPAPPQAPVPGTAPADGAAPAEPAAPADDWAAYAAQGLGRVYRWNPDKDKLERLVWTEAWAAMNPPADVSLAAPEVHPASGAMVLTGGRAGWWLLLEALPFKPCT